MKTYKTYKDLEAELLNNKDVQSFGGLMQDFDDSHVFTMNLNTKFGAETIKVRILEEL